MKTLKFTFTLIAIFAFGIAQAQTGTTPPAAPPACFSGPTTQGTLTVTCSAIDNTTTIFAADTNNLPAYILVVRGLSTDPDVIGIRATAVCAGGSPKETFTSTGVALLTPTSLAPPVPLTYLFTSLSSCSWPVKIISVTVQELKASSSQSF